MKKEKKFIITLMKSSYGCMVFVEITEFKFSGFCKFSTFVYIINNCKCEEYELK